MTILRRCKGKTVKKHRCRVLCKDGEYCRHHHGQCKQELKKDLEHPLHCSVCLDSLCRPATLQCGHGFHMLCIRKWSEHGSSCPLCRSQFKSSDIHNFSLNLPPIGDMDSSEVEETDNDSEYFPSPRASPSRRRRRRRGRHRSAAVTAQANLENRGLLMQLVDTFLSLNT